MGIEGLGTTSATNFAPGVSDTPQASGQTSDISILAKAAANGSNPVAQGEALRALDQTTGSRKASDGLVAYHESGHGSSSANSEAYVHSLGGTIVSHNGVADTITGLHLNAAQFREAVDRGLFGGLSPDDNSGLSTNAKYDAAVRTATAAPFSQDRAVTGSSADRAFIRSIAVPLASAKAADGNLAVEKYVSVNKDATGDALCVLCEGHFSLWRTPPCYARCGLHRPHSCRQPALSP